MALACNDAPAPLCACGRDFDKCDHEGDGCTRVPAPSGAAVSLPPCPLCGEPLVEWDDTAASGTLACATPACLLQDCELPREAWLALAAPRLPAEVVAVLEAVDRVSSEGFDEGHSDQRIDRAVRAWRAAGRPGLSREGEKK